MVFSGGEWQFDTAEAELAQVQKPPVKSPSARKGTARRSR